MTAHLTATWVRVGAQWVRADHNLRGTHAPDCRPCRIRGAVPGRGGPHGGAAA
ncbi:hypothetical protein ABT391_29020 [Streptomyces jumonjinensis]|uniref:hypothetical protein n=1 Tax=Streptomyces jumonjinensis TaxID=1945 RepID=UPI00188677E1